MAQAIQPKETLHTPASSVEAEKKGFSRLDLVEKVSQVAALLEDTVRLQNDKREKLLEQKEEWLDKNISAVSGKGKTSVLVAVSSIAASAFIPGAGPVVGAVTPSVQQAFDGVKPGYEYYRVEAELRGAHVDQEVQQLSTDIQKSRETSQGYEGAVRGAATFYGR